MLSKYYALTENTEKNEAGIDIFIPALLEYLKKEFSDVRIVPIKPGGTLGVFFCLYLNGEKRFVKTHRRGEIHAANLQREVEIMKLLYGDELQIREEKICVGEDTHLFLIMDFLSPVKCIDVNTIRNLIKEYQQSLKRINFHHKCCYSMENVISVGENALDLFVENDLLSSSMVLKCRNSISCVKSEICNREMVIGHGDLSNVNILTNMRTGKMYVIDWEDSLYTFPEYDFLYWLTFFSQRKYYSADLLRECQIDVRWED